jgi:hypothetical protein
VQGPMHWHSAWCRPTVAFCLVYWVHCGPPGCLHAVRRIFLAVSVARRLFSLIKTVIFPHDENPPHIKARGIVDIRCHFSCRTHAHPGDLLLQTHMFQNALFWRQLPKLVEMHGKRPFDRPIAALRHLPLVARDRTSRDPADPLSLHNCIFPQMTRNRSFLFFSF